MTVRPRVPHSEEATRLAEVWDKRAEELLEQALSEHRGGEDAIATVSAALAALKIALGELPESELAAWFGDDAAERCTCPPELLARGGFRGSCPIHAGGRDA